MSFVNANQILDMQLNAFGGAYFSLINNLEHDRIKLDIKSEVDQYNLLIKKYNNLHTQATSAINTLRHENMLLEIENANLKKRLDLLR